MKLTQRYNGLPLIAKCKKFFITTILLLLVLNCISQDKRAYLGWTEQKIKQYFSADKFFSFKQQAQDSLGNTYIIYQKKADTSNVLKFYFWASTGLCFKHTVVMPLTKLPETVKTF